MILKCGWQGNWSYRELQGNVSTTLNELGYYEVTVFNSAKEPIETISCKKPECYLMSDSGKTIENLSPLNPEDWLDIKVDRDGIIKAKVTTKGIKLVKP